MTKRQFIERFDALIPSPSRKPTLGWHQFTKECIEAYEEPLADKLDELLRAFSFIGRSFTPEVVQQLYLIIEDGHALLNSELFWGAICLQAGVSRQRIGELGNEGMFEIGMAFYEPDVNTGPAFYPIQPDRAGQLSRAFGASAETALLVRLNLDSGMVKLEYNALCYPEGAPCGFSLPIVEDLLCLEELVDEILGGEECNQRRLDALMRGKIEESLRQMEQDGMTPEVRY